MVQKNNDNDSIQLVLQRIDDTIFKFEKTFCIVITALMVLSTFAEVICRYLFNTTLLVGIAELINWSFVWLVFIGMAAVRKKKGHIGISFFVDKTPEIFRRIISIGINILLMGFVIGTIVAGFKFAAGQKVILTTSANIPKTYLYAAIPIGMIFLFLHVCIDTINLLRNKHQA